MSDENKKVTGPLRNFRLAKDADDFLKGEKSRSGRDMTLILELGLRVLNKMPPEERDRNFSEIRQQIANSASTHLVSGEERAGDVAKAALKGIAQKPATAESSETASSPRPSARKRPNRQR